MGFARLVTKKSSGSIKFILFIIILSSYFISGCSEQKNISGKVSVLVICNDSDGGSLESINGTCTDELGSFADSCTDAKTLNEYSCIDNSCATTIVDCSSKDCISGSCSSCDDGIRNGNEEGIDCGEDCGSICIIPPIANFVVQIRNEQVVIGEPINFDSSWEGGKPNYSLYVSSDPSFSLCNADNKQRCLCYKDSINGLTTSCEYITSEEGTIKWYAKVCDSERCSVQSTSFNSPSTTNPVFFDPFINSSSQDEPQAFGILPTVTYDGCVINDCSNQSQDYSLLQNIDGNSISFIQTSSVIPGKLRSYMLFDFKVNTTDLRAVRFRFKGNLMHSNGHGLLKIYMYDYTNQQWVDTEKDINSEEEVLVDFSLQNIDGLFDRILSPQGFVTFMAYDYYGELLVPSPGGSSSSPIMARSKTYENNPRDNNGESPMFFYILKETFLFPPIIIGLLTLLFYLFSRDSISKQKHALIFAIIILFCSTLGIAVNIVSSNINVDYAELIVDNGGKDSGFIFISECSVPQDADWYINGNCSIINETISFGVDKKIFVNGQGTLKIENSVLTFQQTADLQSGIISYPEGSLEIIKSNISSIDSKALIFKSLNGASLVIEGSSLSDFGSVNASIDEAGIWIGSNSVLISGSIINSNAKAIILSSTSFAEITGNDINSRQEGIHLLGSADSIITDNSIKVSSDNSIALILISDVNTVSQRNTIDNNEIECLSSLCSPIFLSGAINNTISTNSLITVSNPAFLVTNQSYGNQILNNELVIKDKVTVVGYLLNSNDNVLMNNRVVNEGGLTPDFVFMFRDSNNNKIKNDVDDSIDILATPYYFKDSTGNRIINSTISSSFSTQVKSGGIGENYFISSLIEKEKVEFEQNSSSLVRLNWVFDLSVNNGSNPIYGASVKLKDSRNVTYLNAITLEDGKVEGVYAAEFFASSNYSIDYNPQTLIVNALGYSQYEEEIYITEDQNREVTLEASSAVEEIVETCADVDNDAICDSFDNCPEMPNVDQENQDHDFLGDACDLFPTDPFNDWDKDSIGANEDNCPSIPNSDQSNIDGDEFGDACDPCPEDKYNDAEGDLWCGQEDNCPFIYNYYQVDCDDNSVGDACDKNSGCISDYDEDGIPDQEDNCLEFQNPSQEDTDGDLVGDACDLCDYDKDNDKDMDTFCGDTDNCPSIFNINQRNQDGDSFGDVCDMCPFDSNNDLDFDGVCGDVDNCPTKNNPSQADCDRKNGGDACDLQSLCSSQDIDGDTILNAIDNCPEKQNANQVDSDNDLMGDACDLCPLDSLNDYDMDGLCSA